MKRSLRLLEAKAASMSAICSVRSADVAGKAKGNGKTDSLLQTHLWKLSAAEPDMFTFALFRTLKKTVREVELVIAR